ncbi:hypothetical protein ACFQ4K_16310 [Tistrella bauzanensis]
MRDPYAVYARHVLGLEALDPVDADPGLPSAAASSMRCWTGSCARCRGRPRLCPWMPRPGC